MSDQAQAVPLNQNDAERPIKTEPSSTISDVYHSDDEKENSE